MSMDFTVFYIRYPPIWQGYVMKHILYCEIVIFDGDSGFHLLFIVL